MEWVRLLASLPWQLAGESLRGAAAVLVLAAAPTGGALPVPATATPAAIVSALLHTDPARGEELFADLERVGLVARVDNTLVFPPLGVTRRHTAASHGHRDAAARKAESRANNPERTAAYNEARRAARAAAKRDAIVTPPCDAAVTPCDAVEVPPSPVPQVSPLSHTLSSLPSPPTPSPLPVVNVREATTTATTTATPVSLPDGTAPLDALAELERASSGRFTHRASARVQLDLVRVMAEHGVTRADIGDLGAVIVTPPSWCKISGLWTCAALLGKPNGAGERSGNMLSALLAVALEHKIARERKALEAANARAANASPPRATLSAATIKLVEDTLARSRAKTAAERLKGDHRAA